MKADSIKNDVAKYYNEKIKGFGSTHRGVDWSTKESHHLRFIQLSRAIDVAGDFSILDLGCGYGAYLDYLNNHYTNFYYVGIDISEEMITAAKKRHELMANAVFKVGSEINEKLDFAVASGIFNVMLDHEKSHWEDYFYSVINSMNKNVTKAFSFNCLTLYSDVEKMKNELYYADPLRVFDYCKRHFSRNVALLHDYNLYEFTIIVRKDCE